MIAAELEYRVIAGLHGPSGDGRPEAQKIAVALPLIRWVTSSCGRSPTVPTYSNPSRTMAYGPTRIRGRA